MRKMAPLEVPGSSPAAVLAQITGKKVDLKITKAASLKFLQASLKLSPAQAVKLLGT